MNSAYPLTAIIRQYRAETFCISPALQIRSQNEAVSFINDRGFVYFWPIKGITLPSLWAAAAGDRPVADEHDDPGHITWNWKDNLLGKKQVYYARILRRKNTFISLEMLPYFYSLSPNYGDWETDYLEQYQQGKMTAAARSIYEALLREGPLNTIMLRKASRLTGEAVAGLFARALDDLMIEFKILPVAVSDAGAWHYCHVYDITPRFYPDLQERSRPVNEKEARMLILRKYFDSVGAASIREVQRLFSWLPDITSGTLDTLTIAGDLTQFYDPEFDRDPVWGLAKLLRS